MEIEWLDSLESRVRDAVARLGELREENGTLRERIEELETQLATTAAAAKSWEVEREEVRRRVEGLTGRLEGLVG